MGEKINLRDIFKGLAKGLSYVQIYKNAGLSDWEKRGQASQKQIETIYADRLKQGATIQQVAQGFLEVMRKADEWENKSKRVRDAKKDWVLKEKGIGGLEMWPFVPQLHNFVIYDQNFFNKPEHDLAKSFMLDVARIDKRNKEDFAEAEAKVNNRHPIKPSFSSMFQSEKTFAYFLELLEDQGLIDDNDKYIGTKKGGPARILGSIIATKEKRGMFKINRTPSEASLYSECALHFGVLAKSAKKNSYGYKEGYDDAKRFLSKINL